MGRGDLATLVRICDPAGRPRGTGFVADDRGTVVTSHEAVDGLDRVMVRAPGDGVVRLAGGDAVVPVPEADLALIRTEGLDVRPLPVTVRDTVESGAYVRVPAGGWREARVLGAARATYTAADRFHLLDDALELAIGADGSDALRPGGTATGGPVLDATTGSVVAVLGTALHTGHPAAGFAVPLRAAAARDPAGPLAELLRRNAATVPGFGADLNVAGALRLAAVSLGPASPAGSTGVRADPIERPVVIEEFEAFEESGALVLGLTGDAGTGRTTELTALAARRARSPEPAVSLWLRGADLREGDASLADAVARTLSRSGRIVAGVMAQRRGPQAVPGAGWEAGPGEVARVAREAGRPLFVLLDGPEEMPAALAGRLRAWTAQTTRWLCENDVRLVIASGHDHWERSGYGEQPGALRPRTAARTAVHRPVVRLTALTEQEAEDARVRYGLPPGALTAADARHPLALRLLAEVREALPGDVPGRPSRDEIFGAYLDLVCLRAAARIAAAERPEPRATAVRRLAARVSGQVHEAARRSLGSGEGGLDRETFGELFPWRTGWASAVLGEGLLVRAGAGYRFAHEEFARWLQAAHLDVDGVLHPLLGHAGPDAAEDVAPTPPRHQIGTVVHALLLIDRRSGPSALGPRLTALIEALDEGFDEPSDEAFGEGEPLSDDARWWACGLLRETLLRVPVPRAYLGVLRTLADRVTRRSLREGGPRNLGGLGEFGPRFWQRLRVGEAERMDLLRRLVPADGAPERAAGTAPSGSPPRFLDAVAEELARSPRDVQPLLCRWFTDDRPLPAGPGAAMRPTVAGAAQALLHTHRGRSVDDLCEALVSTAHPRAAELLAALVEDEPSAVCRAVDRWAHDDSRPGRRLAAATYGPAVAVRVTGGTDRDLLRFAALALLARPADTALHGAALALLVRDPRTRPRYLGRALAAYRRGEQGLTAEVLAGAASTHPEPVFAAFRARLREAADGPGVADGVGSGEGAGSGDVAGDVLRALAEFGTPALARRAAVLVAEHAGSRPDAAAGAAAFVERRLEHGPAARAVLVPLVMDLLRGRPVEVRGALATVLAAPPGSRASEPLRAGLLDVLLEHERHESGNLAVLDALLEAAALGSGRCADARTRELVHRTGVLFVRTLEGANRFDRRLVELAHRVPGFAAQVVTWQAEAPREWAALVGPSTRRTLEALGRTVPMPTEDRGHGSLRPA